MKEITDLDIMKEFRKWFLNNWNKVFTSMPIKYEISIDHEDDIFVHGEFKSGSKDFSGQGNKYKWMLQNQTPPQWHKLSEFIEVNTEIHLGVEIVRVEDLHNFIIENGG